MDAKSSILDCGNIVILWELTKRYFTRVLRRNKHLHNYLEEDDAVSVLDNGRSVRCEKVFNFRIFSAGVEFSGRFTAGQAWHFYANRSVI